MEKWGDQIACVLVEPIVGNFGIVEPKEGFLPLVHDIAAEKGALIVYDEVITAFRFHYGGAQDLLGLTPDLTAFGKIIGGGLTNRRLRWKKRDYGTSRSTRTCLSSGDNGRKSSFHA